ncbi:MAG: hypothetical protein HOC41_06050 [Candidatus Marinimicrobia bacterium]|jgi:hypothetical protein|nr:hypothetical protein [Candidatus Neomarinimicrobiota bacterium]MBT4155550.1 hypothetical protein [Candidatus Neomarinimicrobiota bacterium]MBT4555227.1 hypothetical protein [Candidatus Neomarinimicrobiota bacterium]MBT4752694.1 hypothetical protein [Candidatus Neomarinimicrobiota bacterium]MBT5116197.1 hypothetical protein [Candidatus Neomarinimicrobiota bacterium]|tara:strand:- start:641 stop:1234 length:594 start_codon:yes stop_codon:yes gene_type:complete
MTNKLIKTFLTILCVMLAFNCSSGGPDLSPEPTRKVMKNIPDWFITAPTKAGYRYETATATSQDLQLAVNKATLDAASRLAATINSVMDGFTKRVQEENGLGADSDILDRYSQVQSQTIATALKDYSVAKKQILEEKSNSQDIFRAYVLLEWNETAAHQRLLEKIKSDKELYDAVRASDLMEEMESKVEAYRQRMGG